MNRRLLPAVLGTFAIALAFAPHAQAFNVLSSQDSIIAIDFDPPGPDSSYPGDGNIGGNETPALAIDDDVNTKYLNFGEERSGFIVTPSGGSSTVQSFQITTANDAPARDPFSFELYGTNDAIVSTDNSFGTAENWTLIDGFDLTGTFELPLARLTPGPLVPITNGAAYTSYKMLFPTLRDAPATNSMQIAEISFFPMTDGSGGDLLIPGSTILAVDADEVPDSAYPAAESPQMAVDVNVNTKYLNFGRENSGFIVTPVAGATAVNGFQITTANDSESRDPATWELYGTNDDILSEDNSQGDGENWTLIETGSVALPVDRFTAGPVVNVTNTTEYKSYRMVFPTLKDPLAADANSIQYAEIQFFAEGVDAFVEINRDTGAMRIVTNENTTIGGYELESNAQGVLDDSAWSSITDTGADPNDTWMIDSAPGDPNNIAESDGPDGANDGFALTTGSPLNLGNIWRRTPLADDLIFRLKDENGDLVSTTINYVGSDVVLGDYNGDGFVSALDWPDFRAGLGGDYTGTSPAQAYLNGDLDGDFDSDLDDFNLFVEAGGGFAALFGTQVPEPSSIVLLLGGGLGLIGYRRLRRVRAQGLAALGLVMTAVLVTNQAEAQTFATSGNVPTVTTPDPIENVDSGPINMFDDSLLDGQINTDLFNLDYNMFTEPPLPLQYAGLGVEPKTVFMDYGSSISANWFAYAQRSGGIATADRVGMFEFWFSDTDFMNVLPATAPDAVLDLKPDDPRVLDSIVRPYPLGRDDLSGRYVAMRLTISEVSGGVGNIGGHEFRLMQGPSDIVLEIDRSDGNMTMRNNGSLAQAIDFKAYEIRSDAGGLDASGFNGIGGDAAAFTLGNGTGNGWEVGDGSDSNRLLEAYFSGSSTFPIAGTVLQLGSAYNELAATEDVMFRYTNSQGHVFDGRVEYVGESPITPGDYNGDGVVNAADYALGRDQIPGFFPAFLNNFGAGSGSGSGAASVPEPSSLGILIIGIAVVGSIGARRRFA